jgi:hypothetical protein
MRRSERIAELRRLLKLAKSQPMPFDEWAYKAEPLMQRWSIDFERGLGGCRSESTSEKERPGTIVLMMNAMQQEIDDMAEEEPHWTTTPTFWVSIVAAVAGIIAAVISFLAWRYPLPPPSPELPPLASPAPPSTTLAPTVAPQPSAPSQSPVASSPTPTSPPASPKQP